MALIQIYIARWCSACAHSRDLFVEITERYPQIAVELIDMTTIAEQDLPEDVFATPTWLWNGHLYCLGNPEPAALWQRLAELIAQQPTTAFKDNSHGRQDATPIDDGDIPGFV
jgi:predicted thioredoxin/glutaredoxin